jgi:hypothetical protein
MKRRKSRNQTPPPEIDGCRVIEYAFIKKPVRYSARNNLYRLTPSTGESVEVGAVPRLVIAQPLRGERQYYLLHCDRNWNSVGGHSGFKSLADARKRAERSYPGVSRLWRPLRVSKREALAYERRAWKHAECSFCGRIPPEIGGGEGTALISSRKATICRSCIEEFYTDFIQPTKPRPNSA